MKTCFSKGKLMKQFGTPPLLANLPFLTSNPPLPLLLYQVLPRNSGFEKLAKGEMNMPKC